MWVNDINLSFNSPKHVICASLYKLTVILICFDFFQCIHALCIFFFFSVINIKQRKWLTDMIWVVQMFSLIWHQNFMWDHSYTAVLKDVLKKKEPFWKYVSFTSKHIDIIGIIKKTNKKEYYKCIHFSDRLLERII